MLTISGANWFGRRAGTCRLHAIYMNQPCIYVGKWEKLSSTAGRAILAKPAQHADAPHAFGLLRARRERPRGRAAEGGQEFSSSDVACHVTLGLGVIHAMDG